MSSHRLDAAALKQHAGIEPYKSRLPDLKQDSGKYVAKCRWHGDSQPSLDVYQKDGVWLWGCFPCKATGGVSGGDVFSFVQKMDRISFVEALKKARTA
jgi:DNA primase